ncbi:MAG: hypothetical protein EXQ77_02770 [Thermoleophilia bacterium]|nr:hypothetical protein [Thermoleophilia bacterium]
MNDPAPAFYALRGGTLRDWVTLLHPPYTAWHLAYVVAGGCLAPEVAWGRLGLTVLAFALALGIGAHALDELRGRPLRTAIPAPALVAAAALSVLAASAIGLAVAFSVTLWLVPLVALGGFLVPAYNLEWLRGRIHTDLGFALAWGAFPVLVAFVAQTGRLEPEAVAAATWATVLSLAQRRLSTEARSLRREAVTVLGHIVLRDGTEQRLDRARLLAAPEAALRLLALSAILVAAALAALRL